MLQVCLYHGRYYRPENLCLIITGLVTPGDVFRALKPVEEKMRRKVSGCHGDCQTVDICSAGRCVGRVASVSGVISLWFCLSCYFPLVGCVAWNLFLLSSSFMQRN